MTLSADCCIPNKRYCCIFSNPFQDFFKCVELSTFDIASDAFAIFKVSPAILRYPQHLKSHSSALAWKIPWMEEPGGLRSKASLRVGQDWATSLSLFTFMHWRRKWQPTPVFLPGGSQGWRSLVGCRLWGHRVGHDWSGLAAAAAAEIVPGTL